MKPCNKAKHVDGEGMFLSRAALLICKAHVNAGSVTCHLRGSRSSSRVAFYICWSSSRSVRALVGGSETDGLFSVISQQWYYLFPSFNCHPPTHCGKDKTHAYQAQMGTCQFSAQIQQFAARKLWGPVINFTPNCFLMYIKVFSFW